MSKKSPLALVKEKFGDKQQLVAAVQSLAEGDLWLGRTARDRGKDRGLENVSNAKLLRLHGIFTAVKAEFGSREKLIGAILTKESRTAGPPTTRRSTTSSTAGATGTSTVAPSTATWCVSPLKERGAQDPHRRRGGEAREVRGLSDAAAHPLSRTSCTTACATINEAFNAAIAENKYRGRLPRRVPHQGEPAPRGAGGDPRRGPPYHYGIEVGSKPECLRGPLGAQRQRVAHRLQRLQRRQLHPHGAHRPQARQEGHPHRREARRGARHRARRQGRWAWSR
jgi:hypothetical protein